MALSRKWSGHWWPGSPLPVGNPALGPVNQDINASEEIWKFFRQYSLDEVTATNEFAGTFSVILHPNLVTENPLIEFTLPSGENVQIFVTNALGRLMTRQVHSKMSGGRHKITQNVSSWTPGSHFLTLLLGDQKATFPINISH